MRLVILLSLLLASAGAVPSVLAQRRPASSWEQGIVIATDGDAGSLVLESGDDYRYVIVDFAAPIRDFRGHALRLRDVRGGDFVEYRVEWPERYRLATELRVTPSVDPARLGAHR